MDKSPKRYSLDGMGPRRPVNRPAPVQRPAPRPPLDPSARPAGIENSSVPSLSSPPPRPKRTRRQWFSRRRLTIGISGLAALIVVAGAVVTWMVHNSIIVANTSSGAVALQEQVDPAQLRGEGDGRVNVLLIGVDEAASLSDTIMLVSLDPIAKDVAMLSIPRDLYVNMGPDFGSAKINAAHAYGEQYEYEGGGPQLLIDTLEDVLAVPIHYYGRVNFEGFAQAIDIVDGVTIEVEEDLVDPSYPDGNDGFDPFTILAGTHTLDGERALKYARSRYSTSDFDRSRRQQQILLALKQRTLSLGTLSNPTKVASLLSSLSSNAQTNMSLSEMMRVIELTEDIESDDIVRAQLDASADNFLSFSNVYGQSVLVPTAGDFSQIQEYVRGLLVDSYIKDESARVSILNGTEQAGLATDTGAFLRSFGYQVDNIDNASEQNYTQTVIFDYTGQTPYTLRYLEQRFGVTAQRRQAPSAKSDFDIEVVIGGDYDPAAE
ncbi:MAG: LCP family protein [Candidatus Saccharimonadales bacterium]